MRIKSPFLTLAAANLLLTAIGTGIAPDNYSRTPEAETGLEKIRKYLKNNPPANVHNRAMKMLASLYVDGIMTKAQRELVYAVGAQRQQLHHERRDRICPPCPCRMRAGRRVSVRDVLLVTELGFSRGEGNDR
ncbi:MAG: hypothetical protein ACYSWQ_09670 [Planctomycetota bacterium]|jgi:hypothetical protein